MVEALGPAERSALLDLIADPDTPRYVIQRAVVALRDDERASSTASQAWLTRFRHSGARGLAEPSHPGQRRGIEDAVAVRILTEPLRSVSPRVTSRDVAAATGVSQSSVVRIWARAYDHGLVPDATRLAIRGRWQLFGAHVSRSQCLILLTADPRGHEGQPVAARARASENRMCRLSLRALLGADLLRGDAADGAPSPLVEAILRRAEAGRGTLLLTREPLDERLSAVLSERPDVQVERLSAEAWQALLTPLEGALASEPTETLSALLDALRHWARDRSVALDWRPGADPAPARHASRGNDEATPAQRLAGTVTVAIQDAILAGQLRSGDRVTESFVARKAHVSRSRAREALRSLAHDGLVDLEAGSGAIVPEPTLEDVKEIYTARRALGAIIIKRATDWRPDTITPVRRAVEVLQSAARTRDSWITGEADLDFQDAIARSVDMRRIPGMFTRLHAQLSMFVAVMGLDYAYDVQAMVDDDDALFKAIIRRDTALALRLWERKVTASALYMTRQLESRHAR